MSTHNPNIKFERFLPSATLSPFSSGLAAREKVLVPIL
jgi:hypothetical protein